MKILIVSDTHGRNHYLTDIIKRVSPIDLFIHLGDFENGEDYIKSIITCPVEFVTGNCDFFKTFPKDKVVRIGKYTVLLTHGHRYGVKSNTDDVLELAKKNKADIVMFGHTHMPLIDLSGKIWIVNPGSLSLPRQNGRIPTYIIMELDDQGEAHFTLNYYQE